MGGTPHTEKFEDSEVGCSLEWWLKAKGGFTLAFVSGEALVHLFDPEALAAKEASVTAGSQGEVQTRLRFKKEDSLLDL